PRARARRGASGGPRPSGPPGACEAPRDPPGPGQPPLSGQPPLPGQPPRPGRAPAPGQVGGGGASVLLYTAGGWARAPLARRRELRSGDRGAGPALIAEDFATTLGEPGWRAGLAGRGDLLLGRGGAPPAQGGAGPAAGPGL